MSSARHYRYVKRTRRNIIPSTARACQDKHMASPLDIHLQDAIMFNVEDFKKLKTVHK